MWNNCNVSGPVLMSVRPSHGSTSSSQRLRMELNEICPTRSDATVVGIDGILTVGAKIHRTQNLSGVGGKASRSTALAGI